MRKSRIKKRIQIKLIEMFVIGSTARVASEILGLNKSTVAYYFYRVRKIIFVKLKEEEKNTFSGEVELDESYFGGVRKGKRGRGAAGKIPVFGILKRGGKVYTTVIKNSKTSTLFPIIREKVLPDSIVYTDQYRSYNKLDTSGFKHFRINHSKKFGEERNHINGIENFLNQAKRYMRKYNGIPKEHFHLFLKECEWRFNNPNPKVQLSQLKVNYSSYLGQPLLFFPLTMG